MRDIRLFFFNKISITSMDLLESVISLPDGLGADNIIYDVNASDVLETTISYTFVDAPVDLPFSINSMTGEITTNRIISRSVASLYNLEVCIFLASSTCVDASNHRTLDIPVSISISAMTSVSPSASIVVANRGSSNKLYNFFVFDDSSIELNNSSIFEDSTDDYLSDLAFGDLNGDGYTDIVFSNEFGGRGENENIIYLGGINNSFTRTTLATTNCSSSVLLADVDMNQTLDMIVLGELSSSCNFNLGFNAIFLNDTSDDASILSFQSAMNISSEMLDSKDVVAGDFNNDGHVDMAVANHRQVNKLYLGNGMELFKVE